MNFNQLKYIFFIIILTASCKKEDVDEEKPMISMTAPAQNLSVSVGDTISVKGEVTDNMIIKSIQIGLIDENYVSQSSTTVLSPNTKNYTIDTEFVISNEKLVSGKYYLLIKVSDGFNERKSYRTLYISELPKIHEGYIIFSHTSLGSTNIYKVSSENNELIASVQDELADATISSLNRQIYFTGKTNESTTAISIETGAINWEENNIYNSITDTYIGATKMIENYVYVTKNKNIIVGIDENGVTRKSLYIAEDYLSPKSFFRFDDLVAITVKGNNNIYKLETANYTSGASLTSIYSNFDIENIFSRNDDILYLVGDKNDTLLIKTYSIYYDMIDDVISLPGTDYKSSVKTGENLAYILANNSIYKFNFIYSTISEIISGINATEMIFDDVNNEIILYSANTFYRYSYPSFSLIEEINFSETIDKIEILYNK